MCNVMDIETQDNRQYLFFPVSSSALRFKVKAMNDAHVALTRGNYENDPMTELHFGGSGNTKTVIRRDRKKPDKAQAQTVDILSGNEYVGLWIRWYNSFIAAGFEGSDTPFISFDDPSPHPIDHVAVCTGWGSSGMWKIEVSPVIFRALTPKPLSTGTLRWVKMTKNNCYIPPDAVIGGFEGEVLYIARAKHNSSVCPGKYVPSLKCAFISSNNQAHEKESFEILCGYNFVWVESKGDSVPPNAFPGGTINIERNNDNFYIGRAMIESNLIPGKVHLHYNMCYIAYGESEREANTYEVLVIPEKMPQQLIWHPPKRNNSDTSSYDSLPRPRRFYHPVMGIRRIERL